MDVFPDFSATAGTGLERILGALLTIVLIVAVLMILVSAIGWAIASSHGNHTLVSKAKAGLFVGLAAAVLAGSGVAWMNFLIGVGTQL